jgi:hypothetical protein
MKTQRFAFLLSFCWMIGMVAVFSFPPKITIDHNGRFHSTSLKEIAGPELHLRASFENPTTPPLEIDWRLSAKLNSEWIPGFFSLSTAYLAPSYFQKSKALLDIHQFFIRFFYTW